MKTTLLETPPTEEKGGGGSRGRGLQEDRANKTANGFQSHLELRLGISLNTDPEDMVTPTTSISDGKGGVVGRSPGFLTTPEEFLLHQKNGVVPGWAKRWFSETGNGFVHPWSLAARQQKAVFEKAHHKPNASSTVPRATHPPPPPPPVVGWPPVRAFRKNQLGAPHPTKSEMEGEKDAKRVKTTNEGEAASKAPEEVRTTMYVKVNMEGYAVGRKINLKAHDSYESLSRALQKMFNNFLSSNYFNSEQDEEDNVPAPDYLLIYEDHEGDRMLVGDVPWEIFIASVKRLYIANTPGAKANDDGGVPKDKQ